MSDYVIENADDVLRFVNKTLFVEHRFQLKKEQGDVGTSVDLLVFSPALEKLLYDTIAEHETFGGLIALPLKALHPNCPYPKDTRIYFCTVYGALWPRNIDMPRNDCESLLFDTATVDSHVDIQFLISLLMHSWLQRMQVPEPFFWFQDVVFYHVDLLDDFIMTVCEFEQLRFNIRVAPEIIVAENYVWVRFYMSPWRLECDFVPYHGPTLIN